MNTGIEVFLPLINCFIYYTQPKADLDRFPEDGQNFPGIFNAVSFY